MWCPGTRRVDHAAPSAAWKERNCVAHTRGRLGLPAVPSQDLSAVEQMRIAGGVMGKLSAATGQLYDMRH